ncbi:MAG: AEC family transporter [Rhodospirillales bacterium]|nr:AEC family transporter [Rhodospirillales bacterium]
MTEVLFDAVLPIFAVCAFGFLAGRVGLFDKAMALVINRFVFYLPLPALTFNLLASARFDAFSWPLLIGYFLSEGAVYLCALLAARYLFKCGWLEAILLGLAAAYSNHVLFVLPIAVALFGDAVSLPIVAIITVDSLVMFGLTLVAMDALTLDKPSLGGILLKLGKNPTIVGLVAGLVFGLAQVPLPTGVGVFLDFVSATAAPCALFALGIVLAERRAPVPLALPLTISIIKVVIHPLIATAIILFGYQITPELARPALMVAAGPCGAMAFVMAMNYGVRVDAIARAILITMVASVLTVSLMAGY